VTFWAQNPPEAKRLTLPRHVTLRRGTMDDEYATFEVMRRTMGHEMAWSHHAAARRHLQTTADSSFWLAEEKQRFTSARVVGYARSVVREGVWSLTEFFVLPGHHRQGIGGSLLARCCEDGENSGANTRLILASQHAGADSLYVRKLDCYPRLPMMMLVGPLGRLRPPEAGGRAIVDTLLPSVGPAQSPRMAVAVGEFLRAEPLLLTPDVVDSLNALDRAVVGYARPLEHQFWAHEMAGIGGAARIFRRARRSADGAEEAGEIVGYAYIGAYSSGPALASVPEELPHMLAHVAALSVALGRVEPEQEIVQPIEQYWTLAGTNEITLRWLLECGWQIVFHYLFMSSRPIGTLDRYVGYNPLYFL
jgi:GNAT superfamily N-acetyltransferase